jgi:predicted short-subunit dehydrogenase-like oxidoreductase (DUF2520 family)
VAPYNISFIGAGSVAEALCDGLIAGGHRILTVSSKGGVSASELAKRSGALWIRDCSIPDNCDIVIVSVTDTAVAEVADKIRLPEKTVIVHTAGSVEMSALRRKTRCGVLYPLQTFTKGFSPDLREVPFFIEGAERSTLILLRELVESMGAEARECDSARRKYLHLAAVFTNNFANFMMTTGGTIAAQAGFDPEVLRPLIEETARKALRAGPPAAQTGPAVRHDAGTMKNHIELLSFSPEYSELYIRISELIMDYYKKRTL